MNSVLHGWTRKHGAGILFPGDIPHWVKSTQEWWWTHYNARRAYKTLEKLGVGRNPLYLSRSWAHRTNSRESRFNNKCSWGWSERANQESRTIPPWAVWRSYETSGGMVVLSALTESPRPNQPPLPNRSKTTQETRNHRTRNRTSTY